MSKKYGYTLSEVLVSMLVIGVIAAVCTPMIMNVIPNKNAIMIKKAYYAVDNIVKVLINDSYYYPDMKANCYRPDPNNAEIMVYDNDLDGCFIGFVYAGNASGLKIKASSGSLTGNQTAKNKFRKLFISYLDTKLPLSEYLNKSNDDDDDFEFVPTADGLVYNLSGGTDDFDNDLKIMIDVNGPKGPNAFAPSYDGDGDNKNKCASYATWTASSQGGHLDNRRFDRIVIAISPDGTISIPNNQLEFMNIITSTDSEYKKDNSED